MPDSKGELKRYNIFHQPPIGLQREEDPEGGWMRYDDHTALLSTAEATIKELRYARNDELSDLCDKITELRQESMAYRRQLSTAEQRIEELEKENERLQASMAGSNKAWGKLRTEHPELFRGRER